ncbi:MAG: ATP-binding cassette domain-containing protein [Armatimonadetes bacterium]|nr:ATP-binding cassette domain-containing protein [Armatimonadota bacterium]
MISLSLSNLTHEYNERLVFQSVSFQFDGKCMSITGCNGSGKSTLTRIIAGLVTPIDGCVTVSVDGSSIARENLRDVVGLAAPDVRLYGELTARENLEFLSTARSAGIGKHRIGEVLEQVGLANRGNDPVRELSSGLRQRACFAAALLHEPLLLLLDEPSTNLDEDGISMLNEVIQAQMRRGMVIIATNDVQEAALGQKTLDLGGRQ